VATGARSAPVRCSECVWGCGAGAGQRPLRPVPDACQNPGVDADDSAFDLTDLDRYIEEHGIAEKDHPAAFAVWIAERTGGPVPRFEKVEEPEDE
jgi:hypothetical protein